MNREKKRVNCSELAARNNSSLRYPPPAPSGAVWYNWVWFAAVAVFCFYRILMEFGIVWWCGELVQLVLFASAAGGLQRDCAAQLGDCSVTAQLVPTSPSGPQKSSSLQNHRGFLYI